MITHDLSLKLSKNFSLREFLVSDSYPELVQGIVLEESQILKFYYLCQFALQVIRNELGPVHITSGFRPQVLNAKIGGVDTSQHRRAEAVDFNCGDRKSAYNILIDVLEWPGELILYPTHLHLALPRPGVKADRIIK